jgi:hypothetical protein
MGSVGNQNSEGEKRLSTRQDRLNVLHHEATAAWGEEIANCYTFIMWICKPLGVEGVLETWGPE